MGVALSWDPGAPGTRGKNPKRERGRGSSTEQFCPRQGQGEAAAVIPAGRESLEQLRFGIQGWKRSFVKNSWLKPSQVAAKKVCGDIKENKSDGVG